MLGPYICRLTVRWIYRTRFFMAVLKGWVLMAIIVKLTRLAGSDPIRACRPGLAS